MMMCDRKIFTSKYDDAFFLHVCVKMYVVKIAKESESKGMRTEKFFLLKIDFV